MMKEKLKNKKIVYTIMGIVAVLLVVVGITYAYWLITKNQTEKNVISSACLDITLTNEQNDITLTNQFPISDEEGMKLTPYEFTVTNNCNTSVDYHVNLESIGTESETVIPSAIKAMLDENTPQVLSDYSEKDITIEGASEARLLGSGTLSAQDTEGSSVGHTLRLWIDEDAPISEIKKTFRSKISVTIGQGIEASQGSTLSSLILADAQTNNYLYSTIPDFSQLVPENEFGLYRSQDDYGTSYYFRGDVENNYVMFGAYATGKTINGTTYTQETPIYWRIIRINGDGTIRMIYDGTSAVANSEKHTAIIANTVYNISSDNEKYIGYTYADENGNQVDSTIKGVVDEWYENNLEKDYGKYIADSIFCNDREVTYISDGGQFYGAGDRTFKKYSPKLTCSQATDKYTVSILKGNGLLTKPIGLITADEVAMAGGNSSGSKSKYNYLESKENAFWTMSPYTRNSSNEFRAIVVKTNGQLGIDKLDLTNPSTTSPGGVRPVINLKANTLFEGTGTITDPYRFAS